MTVDLRDYKYMKNVVSDYLSYNPDKPVLSAIRHIAIPNSVPLIVVAYYMAKATGGMNPIIEEYIQDLVDFYKYTDVLGYSEI